MPLWLRVIVVQQKVRRLPKNFLSGKDDVSRMKQRITRVRRVQAGLSLAELLVAIFVVAVGVLGTVSALWYGIRSEKYSERRANAVFQGREMLNAIRSGNYPFIAGYMTIGSALNDGSYDNDGDDNGPRKPFNAAPFGNLYPTNPHNFQRRVEMKRLSSDPNSHLNDLAAIKVTMFWNEGRGDKKVTLWAYHRRH